MDDVENSSLGKSSKINSGMLQVFRLDFLWKEANKYAIVGNYRKWNETLDRIWCELVGDVEKDDIEKEFNRLDSDYGKSSKQPLTKGFKGFTKEDFENFSKQKKTLMEKEKFLRRLQNKQGKGTAYDEEDDDFE